MNKVDQYIDSVHEDMRPIVVALRSIIVGASGDFVEEIKWKALTYSLNKMVCSIMVHKNHVNLQLFQGAKIQSVDKLIGTGKNMRHIKFSHLSDLDTSAATKIIEEVIELDAYNV